MKVTCKLNNNSLDLNKNLYEDSVKNITLLIQLRYALLNFYSEPSSFLVEKAPNNWNPVFIHYTYHIFDPYMVGSYPENEEYNFNKTKIFTPWYGPNGLERTKIFLQTTKECMKKENYHATFDFDVNTAYTYEEHIMSKHYIITREILSHKTIIIGVFHIASGSYKRYLIKNVKKLCKLFKDDMLAFVRLFSTPPGHNHQTTKITKYHKNLTQEELEKQVLQLVIDASSMSITNEHILEMLKEFK